ncbi:MAG: dTDP-glucose 4,6-dehydratase [Candidatus Helarchaeota archaeon]|nr:dTDP-glucose 4,6-dehydratase [Candidatus Helarchaeota archaeon]
MLKILVAGGAGFIGSNFIKYVLKEYSNFDILNLDALTYAGNLKNLVEIQDDPRYRFVKGDINNFDLVDSLIKECQCVINFAAESHVDRSIENPNIFIKTNVLGTQTLLNCAIKNSVEKYIQISTDEVYGSIEGKGYFTESSILTPSSPYSASKAAADLLALSYYKTFDLPIIVTRCSNNYGPNQFPEKFLPLMLLNIIKNKKIPIYGDGLHIRDWIYVEDHCSAIMDILLKGKVGEIYNIGANKEFQNLELAKLLLKIMNKSENLIKFVPDRPGHDRRYAIDSSKIRNKLKWKPKISFDEGIKKTINWYRNNQDWINEVISGEYKEYYERRYKTKI